MNRRKPKEIKLTYYYIGNESADLKAESQKRIDEIFDDIFKRIIKQKSKDKSQWSVR